MQETSGSPPGADLRVADLGGPLPFPDCSFDDVVASLVLHYLEDWATPLAELRRARKADYFATSNRTEEYNFSGQTALLSLWDRPLHAMTGA